ncbi:diacylglycerol kinase family protein [Microbacterium sp. NIBRBAC000506063]|uniref:diacylglycerol kinase family protein n=1 Tax=Microbacterium sp. NIBRBAC000506063 TaxID=2734618 RepID=UPI00397EACDA
MRLSVIANPTARGGTAIRSAERAIARLRARASEIDVHSGTIRSDAARALESMRDDRPDAVVVVGGDGTVHLAVGALAGSGCRWR